MTESIYTLRHAAKEILAAAVLEVFPGTQLIEGEVFDGGFSYQFLFDPKVLRDFSDGELLRVEDQMRRICFEKRPITLLEMMRENAQIFFEHRKQWARSEKIGEIPVNIIQVMKIGDFCDACPTPYPSDTSILTAFKLLSANFQKNILEISGACFFSKEELKEFLKKFKEGRKKDYRNLASQLGLFIETEEGRLYLPSGELLRQSLCDKWREMHREMGFQFARSPAHADPQVTHSKVFDMQRSSFPFRLAELREERDFVSIFCDEKGLLPELISSLHFIDQTIKIFGFERRVYLLCPKRGEDKNFFLLKKALETVNIPLSEGESSLHVSEPSIEYHLVDSYGRGWKGPFMTVDSEKKIIRRSLFGSIDLWIARCVEHSLKEN